MAGMTQARLHNLFNYDEETGSLIWKERPREDFRTERGWKIFNAQCAGKVAAAKAAMGKNTYLVVRIDNVLYLQHRIIWLYVYGSFPEKLIDHKNHDGTDNRILNLREATPSQNHANRTYQAKTVSGLKGAFYHADTGRWTARIGVAGKTLYLGMFGTAEEAHAAYATAAVKHYGDFAETG